MFSIFAKHLDTKQNDNETMLKTILSVSGKPGLYRLLSQGKNNLIVEALADGRRMPIHAADRVVSLGDIAMFTHAEDVPLAEVLESLYKHQGGAPVEMAALKDSDALRELLAQVLPDFDRERIYPTDIKKLYTWYNLLLKAGFTSFIAPEAATEQAE